MSEQLHMAEGSLEGTVFAVVVMALIGFGAWATSTGMFSSREGSSKNGDVSKELNPDLFSSRSPDNFH